MQQAIGRIKSQGNTCVTTQAYTQARIVLFEIDPADAGKVSGILAGLFPGVKPNCA
jgi:hypothetical protein